MNWRETPATLSRARAEQPLEFKGPKGALHGIFTPPAPDASPASACVVFPGGPRSGVRRLPVLATRILAAEGFAALRFDLRGRGESAGEVALPNRNEPLGEDVVAAIRHLREAHGQKQFLLAGYCFSALSALDSFKDEADAISGMFFATAAVLEEKPGGPLGYSRAGSATSRLRSMVGRARAPKIRDSFEISFRALACSHARALFLYGEQDRLRAEFRVAEQALFSQLDSEARGRLEIEIRAGRIHTIEGQFAVIERAISWLRGFHPARSESGTRRQPISQES
ncbi:alpha/beta hydrolase [Candidatus Binatus sp.]|uniref:alpha/beta hydrolase n=1 Tax=Candidatus Binatus sp. TaxID=2811406 RepID=UPI002F93EB74